MDKRRRTIGRRTDCEANDEAELIVRARKFGLKIPAERRSEVLAGANRLKQAARLVREFPIPDASAEPRR